MSAAQSLNEWCPNCGNSVKRLNSYTGWCDDCSRNDPYIQLETFLESNADHIEHYLTKGHSLSNALRLVSTDYRPTCLCCGVVIERAPRTAQFCNRNEKCKWAKNRYRYLYKKRNLSKSAALAQVMQELSS